MRIRNEDYTQKNAERLAAVCGHKFLIGFRCLYNQINVFYFLKHRCEDTHFFREMQVLEQEICVFNVFFTQNAVQYRQSGCRWHINSGKP